MSSFYKSNLIDNYDFTLIPAENDFKKEEENINAENVDVVENGTVMPPKVVLGPHIKTMLAFSFLLTIAIFLFLFYFGIHNMEPSGRLDRQRNIIPEKFLDPCNVTNVMPLDEVDKIKNEIDAIQSRMNCINSVAEYNISTSTNEYLTQKLENLTAASTILNKQLEAQKEIRFSCYKQNLEKRCLKDNLIETYKQNPQFFHIHSVIFVILLVIQFCYASKIRKMGISPKQNRQLNAILSYTKMIFLLHILDVASLLGTPYFFPYDIEILLTTEFQYTPKISGFLCHKNMQPEKLQSGIATADTLISTLEKQTKDSDDNNVKPTQHLDIKNEINYPYKFEIELLLSIIFSLFCVYCGYLLFYGCNIHQPLDYLEPCNATNTTTMEEFNGIKVEVKKLEEEMKAITIVAAYNISVPYKTLLLDKHTILANTSTILTQQLNYQRELRYECFKTNLYSPSCREPHLAFYGYCIIVSVLNILAVSYSHKSNAFQLKPEQQSFRFPARIAIFFSCIGHFILMMAFQAKMFYFPCKVDQALLDQFSL